MDDDTIEVYCESCDKDTEHTLRGMELLDEGYGIGYECEECGCVVYDGVEFEICLDGEEEDTIPDPDSPYYH